MHNSAVTVGRFFEGGMAREFLASIRQIKRLMGISISSYLCLAEMLGVC